LPANVQQLARAAFKAFKSNPAHPSLRVHQLKDNSRGSHRPGSWSASITLHYRAIFFIDGDANVWYWIGSHNDYDQFTGKK
jgi:hypothetical protein